MKKPVHKTSEESVSMSFNEIFRLAILGAETEWESVRSEAVPISLTPVQFSPKVERRLRHIEKKIATVREIKRLEHKGRRRTFHVGIHQS